MNNNYKYDKIIQNILLLLLNQFDRDHHCIFTTDKSIFSLYQHLPTGFSLSDSSISRLLLPSLTSSQDGDVFELGSW